MTEIDDADRRILSVVQEDASLSVADIAARAGMSVSPCWRGLRRLREAGVIRAAVNLLDPTMLGLDVMVIASVTLNRQSANAVAAFEAMVGAAPEVLDRFAATGERDYVLRIIAADIAAYERFLAARLLASPEIGSINSQIVLKRVKNATTLPIR
ncbi:MAG: Lrp/AsnC family transcriptional regulator [Alphaproteobacteria bacterium]|nr:Lrp/AsnC family transcriptional regulator [Alphaproteobacteria bacterium]